MFTMYDLKVARVVPTPKGLYVCAWQAESAYEYNFYISSDGCMEGKTSDKERFGANLFKQRF